jgi:hypothetical protein
VLAGRLRMTSATIFHIGVGYLCGVFLPDARFCCVCLRLARSGMLCLVEMAFKLRLLDPTSLTVQKEPGTVSGRHMQQTCQFDRPSAQGTATRPMPLVVMPRMHV